MSLKSAFSGLIAGDKISCKNLEYFVVRCIDGRYVICLKNKQFPNGYVLAGTYKWSDEQQALLDEDFIKLPDWSEEITTERGASIKSVAKWLTKVPTNAELKKVLGTHLISDLEKQFPSVMIASKATMREFEVSAMNTQMMLVHYLVATLGMEVNAAFQVVIISSSSIAEVLNKTPRLVVLKKPH
jgi:hypothetical protein